MLSISFSSETAITTYGYSLLPKEFSVAAYKECFANPYQILSAYKTTTAQAILGTFLAMLVQCLMAYPLSRPNYKFKKHVTIILFLTMLFGGGLVPSYIVNTKYLHLGNSFWVYIFPSLMSAWNVIVFRTFFRGLPDGLVDAAKIDGARELTIFFKIIIPLSTPVIASLGFMSLVGRWNTWSASMLYIRDSSLYTLQYLLQRILREAEYLEKMKDTTAGLMLEDKELPRETLRYAIAVIAAGPMLVVFPLFQKYFAKGLTVGSIKG